MDFYSLYFRLLSNQCELTMEIHKTLHNEVGIIQATTASSFAAKVCPLYCLYAYNLGDFVKAEWKSGRIKSVYTKSGDVTAPEMEAQLAWADRHAPVGTVSLIQASAPIWCCIVLYSQATLFRSRSGISHGMKCLSVVFIRLSKKGWDWAKGMAS